MAGVLPIAAFAMLCAIWGSTWLVIKVGYGGLGPFNVAALRFLLAGALLVPLVPLLRARWPRGREEWGVVLWVGAVLFALDYGLIYWGEQFIESGLTAILFATLPIFTALAAHAYVPGDRITPRKFVGATVAFLGVVALFADRLDVDAADALPMLAIVGSAVCAATASVATKRHGKDLHPAALNAPAMLVGGALLVIASLVSGDGFAIPSEGATWGAILYLAIPGSIVTFLVFFWLLKTWRASTLSYISVFTPLIAVALGLLIGERPTLWTLAGGALILAGVAYALTRSTPGAATRGSR